MTLIFPPGYRTSLKTMKSSLLIPEMRNESDIWPLGGAVVPTCKQYAGSGGSQGHWQSQQHRTGHGAPGTLFRVGGGRTATKHRESQKNWHNNMLIQYLVQHNTTATTVTLFPTAFERYTWHSPLLRSHSQAQSRACQWSGKSSAGPLGMDAWCSSSARSAPPWYAFAGLGREKETRWAWHQTTQVVQLSITAMSWIGKSSIMTV